MMDAKTQRGLEHMGDMWRLLGEWEVAVIWRKGSDVIEGARVTIPTQNERTLARSLVGAWFNQDSREGIGLTDDIARALAEARMKREHHD